MNQKLARTVKSVIHSLLIEAGQSSQEEITLSDLLDQQPSFFSNWSLDKHKITLKTFGDIQDLLRGVRKAENRNLAAAIIKPIIMSFLPGAVSTGLDLLTSLYYKKINTKKTGTVVDQLTVNPNVAAIVDDAVEREFIKAFYNYIMKQDPKKELPPHFNVTKALELYLKSKYSGTYITR